MLAPHLTRHVVQSAERSHSQQDIDGELAAIKIPFLR
jgi:hypothetical protein